MISSVLIILIVSSILLNRYDAINHWGITPEGTIQPQVDSIFYLRRPDDLLAFLNQFDYRQTINAINSQLLSLQMEITDKVQQSTFFQVEIMSHTECLIYYSLKDDDMYSTLKDKKYFNRINTKRMITKTNELKRGNDVYPICDDVPFSMSCFEHLTSMMNRKRLQMSAEVSLHSDDIGVLKENFVKMIKFGLQQEQLSWKYPVLASYFWRARGNAKRAVECARRAIYLAPRKFLDIPLLSLATILQRANKSQDALIIMQSAFNHAPDIFENQIGLGNAQFLASDFTGALKTFNAVAQDNQFANRLEFIQKSMSCFKTIKQKLKEFQHQVDDIFALLNNYKRNQTKLEDYLDRVLSEQVPISNRLADPSFDVYSHHLLHRGQYCKQTKPMTDSKDPILFCDFYTDLQSQLQKEDLIVDIVHHFAEAAPKFIDNFSLGVYRYLNIEDFNEVDNGKSPPSMDTTKKDTQTARTITTTTIDSNQTPLNNFDMKQYEVL